MVELDRSGRRGPRLGLVAGGVVALLVLLVLSFQLGVSSGGAATEGVPTDAVRELEPVLSLYDELRGDAVDAPDSDALVEAAAQGMVDALDDPYAHLYDEQSYERLTQSLQGQFSGVGLVLESREDGPVIVSVIEGAPAEEAGITAGERIVEVNGEDVGEATIEELVALVSGEAGTEVTLTLDGGERGRYTVTVTRAEIDLPNVESRLLDDGAGYVRLVQFTDDVGQDVREAVADLGEQGAEGYVLDLRGNPGGLLDEAIDVASVFIEDGPVVSVQQREGERVTYDAQGEAIDDPLVVLVDGGSASASEIVAGAVKDRDRGQIVGEQTFGKGTVQTIQPLPEGYGVKFTTARYFTPSGDSIEESGVMPDLVVDEVDEQLAQAQEALGERTAEAG